MRGYDSGKDSFRASSPREPEPPGGQRTRRVIDAHAHLTDALFADDADDVIERALAAGLERVLTCGEDLESSERAIALARTYPGLLRVAVGFHPHRAGSFDTAALGRLRELARDPLVVAIGEIGVDLSGRSSPVEEQRAALEAQLALAAECDLPVVLHMREAADELRAALDRRPPMRGQLHCYSEGPAELEGWSRRGLIPSFAGTVTFPRNGRLREAALRAETLLVETDSPYLAPEPQRGQRNEPQRVRDSYTLIASLRGVSVESLAEDIRATARSLFGARWE